VKKNDPDRNNQLGIRLRVCRRKPCPCHLVVVVDLSTVAAIHEHQQVPRQCREHSQTNEDVGRRCPAIMSGLIRRLQKPGATRPENRQKFFGASSLRLVIGKVVVPSLSQGVVRLHNGTTSCRPPFSLLCSRAEQRSTTRGELFRHRRFPVSSPRHDLIDTRVHSLLISDLVYTRLSSKPAHGTKHKQTLRSLAACYPFVPRSRFQT
jgi:hypothetical protein